MNDEYSVITEYIADIKKERHFIGDDVPFLFYVLRTDQFA